MTPAVSQEKRVMESNIRAVARCGPRWPGAPLLCLAFVYGIYIGALVYWKSACCPLDSTGLDMSLLQGSWHVKAVGAVLNPPVRELYYGEGHFRVERFGKGSSAALGWEVLADVGVFSKLDFRDLQWVFPVDLRDSPWLPRLEAHRNEFMHE